ncbi:hypothetical protein Lalb_Chr12g0203761 [Lupinus albus]|uniref:Reverse transcriptase domain-containing protein n=1 Tax=Lupinus albus TaxID=3870 RepID=A0A6A4PMU1_LUPAL|nr:hypothetical protein Lalb_Chr12g0203761 [Lupinus albus]
MRQASSFGFFNPYKVGSDNIPVSLLQFADDAILIGDGSHKNTWVMKSVLQLFELSFGLKINFSKCNLYGVNIQEDILYSHVEFLHCKLYSKSFSYLGIPVGVSHKRKSTWTSLIDKIQSRLSSWYSTNISFVGRVILINVVLSALLVFYLSFYKALISVVRSIQKIQRNFLWDGGYPKRKIHWVK